MERPTVFQSQLDALTAFASGGRFKEELLKAKAEYFSRTGEIFEDDKSFEMRMACFLDYYIYDWPISTEGGKTPAQVYFEELTDLPEADRAVAEGLTRTRHSLFEVRKLAKNLVRLRDCFTSDDIDVLERRQPAGLRKGDLLEARLIPLDGQLLFSTAFCFHPTEVKRNITREIKRLKKHQPGFSARELIWALSKMRLKFERYRNIAVTDIYVFDRKTI
jgi:hypothetical protein